MLSGSDDSRRSSWVWFAHLDFFPLRPCRSLQTWSDWLWIVCRQYFYGVILAGTLKGIICPKANPGSSCAPGHSDTEWRIFSLDRGCVQVFCKDHSIFGFIQPLLCCMPILKLVAENKASPQLRLIVKSNYYKHILIRCRYFNKNDIYIFFV